EIALTELGLSALGQSSAHSSGASCSGPWDVVVGGLGLGYTAATALADDRVASLVVVEYLPEVISWHQRGLVPAGEQLCSDDRCRLVQGDFFALAGEPQTGFDLAHPGRRFHAVLLDIDHSPQGLLHPSHEALYQPEGLQRLAQHLHPGGLFALWSAEPPDPVFAKQLEVAFEGITAHAVTYFNPLLDRDDTNSIYVCRAPTLAG
ncbi:MAG: spermidine synthase, partial [Pseudohongiellaceae bacterium]